MTNADLAARLEAHVTWWRGVGSINAGVQSCIEDLERLLPAILAALNAPTHAEGRAAGIEAAAQWHERRIENTPPAHQRDIAHHRVAALAIRALAPPTESAK